MNRTVFIIFTTLIAMAFNVQAETPRNLDDLIDMRASSGERELEDRGYRHYRTSKIRDSSVGYWWNSRREQCIAVTTKDGRYSTILEQPDSMCGEDSHASDRDRDSRHHGDLDDLEGMRASSGERELEDLGYRHYRTTKIRDSSVGYWWNSRRKQCIAATTKDGRFSSIAEQPESMCGEDRQSSDHDRGSGHHGDLDDLVGMRASSGERELEDWGYHHRKTIKVKDSSIDYWWNRRKARCIAATTKDGRFSSVVDQPESMCDDDR